MKYTYSDGFGNQYLLMESILTYNPMTAEMSSSGTYSGGEPFEIELAKMDMIKLIDVFERAFWAEQDQSEMRTMGSGSLTKEIKGNIQRVNLKYNSDSLNQIDKRFSVIKDNL